MRKVIVLEFVSLDDVIQAPGGTKNLLIKSKDSLPVGQVG